MDNNCSIQRVHLNQRFLFEIHTLEWLRENSDYEQDAVRVNHFFEIIWITKGNGVLWIDMEKTAIAPGKLFFVKPGQVLRFQTDGAPDGYAISFAEDFLGPEDLQAGAPCHKSLYQCFAGQGGADISNDLRTDMLAVVDSMIKEFDKVHLFGFELLKRYFKIFMIYLARHYEGHLMTTTHSRNIEVVQKFMGLLEKKYRDQKMVAEYARELLITPNYLNEIVKKITGSTAGNHIRKRIVLEAKRLGLYSDCCMKEIAYELGFIDSAHFSKFFKGVTGENFSDFKKVKLTYSVAV